MVDTSGSVDRLSLSLSLDNVTGLTSKDVLYMESGRDVWVGHFVLKLLTMCLSEALSPVGLRL